MEKLIYFIQLNMIKPNIEWVYQYTNTCTWVVVRWVGAGMSTPKMSTPIMSIPKIYIPIMSTVLKCIFP